MIALYAFPPAHLLLILKSFNTVKAPGTAHKNLSSTLAPFPQNLQCSFKTQIE